jgi:uncharacterized membrane protein
VNLAKKVRGNLLLGLLTLAPLLVTAWVLVSVINFLDSAIYSLLPANVEPKDIFGVYIPGLGIVVTFVLLLVTGILARTVFGKLIASLVFSLLRRVPFIRGLYRISKQMSSVLFSEDNTSSFKKVALVPFPGPGSRTLGFVTGHPSATESYVFVPTAPNPTSGYVLIFKNSDLQESPLTVEAALQLILSCGSVTEESLRESEA